jgi:hypothetical protein
LISYPQTDEYATFYAGYIQRVPQNSDIFKLLSQQIGEIGLLLQHTTDEAASERPAPEEWSIKEVMGHVCDTERIFAYRALRIARGDLTPLPGFEQDDYVKATAFNQRSLATLLEEFSLQRRSNILCFQNLPDEETSRRGTASNNPISARACIYILAGHVMHHIESLQTSYKLGAK